MISENILRFLQELSKNNNRDWFHANKDFYNNVKKEFEAIVSLLIYEIGKFDRYVIGLSLKECIFRIFRDIRFSNDKTPYKTNFGAYIAKGGRKSMNAGYYLHIEPNNYFLAGGIYMPPPPVLKAVRNDIYNNIDEFKEILEDQKFKSYFGNLWGDKLSSAPRGFSNDVPDIELLKHKHYLVITRLSKIQITDKNFIANASLIFQVMYPFNKFLNHAIGEII